MCSSIGRRPKQDGGRFFSFAWTNLKQCACYDGITTKTRSVVTEFIKEPLFLRFIKGVLTAIKLADPEHFVAVDSNMWY